jgi:hypothetical protein
VKAAGAHTLLETLLVTLPYERSRAVKNTRAFLLEILTGKARDFRNFTELKRRVRWLLKHYPNDFELDCAAEQAPDIFAESAQTWAKHALGRDIHEGINNNG